MANDEHLEAVQPNGIRKADLMSGPDDEVKARVPARRPDSEIEAMAAQIDELAEDAKRGKLDRRAERLRDTVRTLRWTLGEEENLVTQDGMVEREPQ